MTNILFQLLLFFFGFQAYIHLIDFETSVAQGNKCGKMKQLK